MNSSNESDLSENRPGDPPTVTNITITKSSTGDDETEDAYWMICLLDEPTKHVPKYPYSVTLNIQVEINVKGPSQGGPLTIPLTHNVSTIVQNEEEIFTHRFGATFQA